MFIKKSWFILFMFVLVGCTPSNAETILEEGTDQINLNSEYTPNGCTLKNGDKQYTMSIVTNTVDTSTIGTYDVVYELTLDDTTYRCIRKVFVVDLEGPSMSLNPGIDSLTSLDEWVDAGVTVSDNVSATDDITVTVFGEVHHEIGQYEIIYQAIDEAGNSSFMTRIVTVTD
jgi:hypothetical protein